MREVRSFFPRYRLEGEWEAKASVLRGTDLLLPGDWIAVTGSARNDGVYEVEGGGKVSRLRDEAWSGVVWLLAPPADFLALCEEIIAWEAAQENEGIRRERFGEYSVERAVDARGMPATWKDVFASRLAPWRRMFTEVELYC